MALLLGCVADDLTGATDLASMLVRNGMSTIQMFGVPDEDDEVPDAQAIVVALKSRTAPVEQAIDESLRAMRWLKSAGARQMFFKYCSTFDSTPKGNIGPVAEAMLDELNADFTIACPAFPENARTIYYGHLFVGRELLSGSGMRNHPLTPMTDSNLVRVLQAQSEHPVGLATFEDVERGPEGLAKKFADLKNEGVRHVVVDAITDHHLLTIGAASADMALVTGGSGVAMGLPENFRKAGLLDTDGPADELPQVTGAEAVISGSCSVATLGQVDHMSETRPAFFVDPMRIGEGDDVVSEAVEWAVPKLQDGPVLIYSSSPPEKVTEAQDKYGAARIAEMTENALANVARKLVDAGVTKLVVAGGETSGAVVRELGVRGIQIGPPIDPGVPWTVTTSSPRLALKSGNFGGTDFFLKAFRSLK